MKSTNGGAPASDGAKGRVLLVEDDQDLARALGEALGRSGFAVVGAADGQEASELLGTQPFDLVVSDLGMAGMTGIELLRLVRQTDVDVPVILMTGNPSVGTATRAIQLGVHAYLIKPIEVAQVLATAERAVQLHRLARIKREAFEYLSSSRDRAGDRAQLEVDFRRALETVWMAYQPVVSWSERSVIAFEALARTDHPTVAGAGALIAAAEKLGHLWRLGRKLRALVTEDLRQAPTVKQIFVNLHGQDLGDDQLLSAKAPLSSVADRVILEVTERASLADVKDLDRRIARLRDLGFRIALDDLGAGYAGLASFAKLRPDFVKVDMSLIRDVDKEPTKERLVQSVATLCGEMGIQMVCEGVETQAERDTLIRLGCDLFQGYLFALPGSPFPTVQL